MASVLARLLRSCFPCAGRREAREPIMQAEALEGKEVGLSDDDLYFVIPYQDFPKYDQRKPENGPQLSIGEFMFLYNYLTPKENFIRPGAEYHLVMYIFRDKGSIYLIKGWIPTKKGFEQYSAREKSPLVYPGVPLRKSAYNWGVVTNWSRHSAPESNDNTPFQFAKSTTAGIYSSASMDRLTKEINAVIEGKSLDGSHVSRRSCSHGMITSTADTRDRRIRPGAAKGPRKPPSLLDRYRC